MIQKSILMMSTGILLLASISFAQRAAPAHSHGAAEARIAIQGKKGKIEIEAPASAIYGFEHEAKSKADQARKEKGMNKLDEKIAEIFAFAETLNCKIKKEVSEVQQQKDHADVFVEYLMECDQPLKDSELTVSMQKHFPKIKKLNVQLMVDDVQKAQEVLKDGEKIGLK